MASGGIVRRAEAKLILVPSDYALVRDPGIRDQVFNYALSPWHELKDSEVERYYKEY